MLQILSFLTTQNIKKTQFIIWVQNYFSVKITNKIFNKFGKFLTDGTIHIKVLNLTDLCSKGFFKKYFTECISTKNENSIAYSDFIRFLVLYKYGGIYTDGDVFFLRDMKPFYSKNFVHRWSASEDYNTAVMGLQVESKKVENIYKEIFKNIEATKLSLVNGFYPSRIKAAIKKLSYGDIYNYPYLKVYHSALFDPAWLCNDGVLPRLNDQVVCVFSEFYDTIVKADEFDMKKFYNGAFTFHLHLNNCGKCIIDTTSYFYHIQSYFNTKLTHLLL